MLWVRNYQPRQFDQGLLDRCVAGHWPRLRHASEVECIAAIRKANRAALAKPMAGHSPEGQFARARGKAHRPYEFGVKASITVTYKEGFVVGAMCCPENPSDGHTLEGQLDQVERLTGQVPATTFVDKGYKGHGVDRGRSAVFISGTELLSKILKRELRRRVAIEPELGHMNSDGLLGRNFLKGVVGDSQNVILCGAGHNMRKILAHLRALLRLLMDGSRKALRTLIAFPRSRGCSSTGSLGRLIEAKGFFQGRPTTRTGWNNTA